MSSLISYVLIAILCPHSFWLILSSLGRICRPQKLLRWHGSCRMECLSELWPVSGAWEPDQYFLLDCFLPAAGLVSASLFKMEPSRDLENKPFCENWSKQTQRHDFFAAGSLFSSQFRASLDVSLEMLWRTTSGCLLHPPSNMTGLVVGHWWCRDEYPWSARKTCMWQPELPRLPHGCQSVCWCSGSWRVSASSNMLLECKWPASSPDLTLSQSDTH